jgi:hypothetical protein
MGEDAGIGTLLDLGLRIEMHRRVSEDREEDHQHSQYAPTTFPQHPNPHVRIAKPIVNMIIRTILQKPVNAESHPRRSK